MRTNRLFVALAFALAVSGSSVFAQPGPAERQAVPQHQQKMLDIRKKYFNSFKKILTPRQLEKVFAPGPRHFGPKAWQRPKGDWKESRHDRPHHRFCQPETCPRIEAED